MAGLPTNQRDQIMLIVGIVGIALGGLYWYFVYEPKGIELEATRARLEKLEASNQRARTLLARGTAEEMEAEAKLLRDNLELIRTLIPAGNEVPALLDQIVGAARRTGMDVGSFVPGPVVQGEEFDTYRYQMQITGQYHQIGELLSAIGSLRRIIAPVNLSLQPSTAVSAATGPGSQSLNATFDLQTYVVKAEAPGGSQ
ncbi:MAG: type 4a pilus biogenesis protein PilO [Gemmatimonadaceae bacterium]|nr:type 4a pilus biogenesis protein PilO [Gemmatimonadaceae bacterium]